ALETRRPPATGVPRSFGGATRLGAGGAGGVTEHPGEAVSRPGFVPDVPPTGTTASPKLAAHDPAAVAVAPNTTRAPRAAVAAHWISLACPSGCPGTKRAVISPCVAPPRNEVPAGPTSTKDCHCVVPLLSRLKA